jgi:ribosome-associated protein
MTNLKINNWVFLDLDEIEFSAIRAQGSGGQNVNKVSSAIHLRLDIGKSTLPEFFQKKILALADQRISNSGIIVIKAQRFRSQDKNRDDAIERLLVLLKKAAKNTKARRTTKPSRSSQRKRMDSKTKRGKTKALRGKVGRQ